MWMQLFQQRRHKQILALHSLDLAVSTRYGKAARLCKSSRYQGCSLP